MKKVSVVVPCYNAADTLELCVRRLLKQTIGIDELEIILVDDASTDDGRTWGMITAYEKEYPNAIIAIHLEENMRQGGARNVGIEYAGGEYLFFCDADDWITLDALELLYDRAQENDADLVEFNHQNVCVREDIGVKSEAEKAGSHLETIETEEERKKFIYRLNGVNTLGCWDKLYRMSIVKEQGIRFAQGVVMEEPSFTMPFRFYVRKYYYMDRTLYYYFQNPVGTMHRDGMSDMRKYDNAKVWLGIIADMDRRKFLEPYHDELEGLFLHEYLGLNMCIWKQSGRRITPQELSLWQNTVLKLFPGAVSNKYLNIDHAWSQTILGVLKIQVTEESAKAVDYLAAKEANCSAT